MKSDPIVEYIFEPTIPDDQKDSMVLTLRKRGYVASRESDTLRTDATLEGIALAYGSNWFLKPANGAMKATPKLSARRISTNPNNDQEFYSAVFVEGTPYCADIITPACVSRKEHSELIGSIVRAVNSHEELVGRVAELESMLERAANALESAYALATIHQPAQSHEFAKPCGEARALLTKGKEAFAQ